MAELHISTDEQTGILKEIDEGAYDLIFQAMQEDIYSFPIRSFVRETISNGLDSVTERNIALKILQGANEADYYLQRQDGKLLKDSGFDRNYYNAQHLSSEDTIDVRYAEGIDRDSITIKDFGVGLSGSRLRGFFKIGYSSKRNMRDVIGKFGAGSKAGLSTGVEYFVMTTRYNGFQTSFMIFKNDYENITVEHPNGKSEHWHVKLATGEETVRTIYWEPTTECNGVSITLEVKKHNKQAFIDAVKDQFQYFKGRVKLTYPPYVGAQTYSVDHLNTLPLYESDTLILPKYSTFQYPHVVVDGISYGLISWDELELQHRAGKVAIKVKATDVDITQSRESLKWTEKTKNVILEAVKKAEAEASDYVSEKLKVQNPENIFEVVNTFASFSATSEDSDGVASVFSRFLSLNNLKPFYTLDGFGQEPVKVKLDQDLFEFLFYNIAFRRVETVVEGTKVKLKSSPIETFNALRNGKIVWATEATLGVKAAKHILNISGATSFIYARPRTTRTKQYLSLDKLHVSIEELTKVSSALIAKYCHYKLDELEVFDDEELTDDATIQDVLSPAELRKLNQKVLYTENVAPYSFMLTGYEPCHFAQSRVEVPISRLKNHFDEDTTVVICTGAYLPLGKLVEFINVIFPAEKVKVIYVSQENLKHFLPYGVHIAHYYRKLNTKTGELMLGESIRNLNTFKHMCDIEAKYPLVKTHYALLQGVCNYDHTLYKSLRSYWGQGTFNWDTLMNAAFKDKQGAEEITKYLDLLTKFQHVVATGDKDLISASALELFNTDEIYAIDSYDAEFISTFEAELERVACLQPLSKLMCSYNLSEEESTLLNTIINFLNTQNDNI